MQPAPLSTYQLGRIQSLPILRLVSIGAYLDGGIQDILLPLRYLPEGAKEGDMVSVFVYHDNEGRLIATTLTPLAQVGEVGYLRCSSVTDAGAFLEWGIHKDLFVPFREQSTKMQEGYSYIVYLYIDALSGKIVGSARSPSTSTRCQPTTLQGRRSAASSPSSNELGYRCVIEDKHWGLLYSDTAPRMLQRGERIEAYVIRLREEDNKVDLSFVPVGYQKVDGEQARLLTILEKHHGRLPIGDKSPAEDVMRLTEMSKKTFKMVLGSLYKAELVTLAPTEVRKK